MHKPVSIIGYSGHAYVACDIILAMGREIKGYYEPTKKEKNPYKLLYLGPEFNLLTSTLAESDYFVGIGDNKIRRRILMSVKQKFGEAISIIHPNSYISPTASVGWGSMVSTYASINAMAKLGIGTICNTGSTIEHECILENYVHIAPGATLCGNVSVGEGTLIGANAVVKPGISIGRYATIGSGAVIVKHVPDHATIIGNPQRSL